MAEEKFDKIHIALMQDMLPVGLAMVDRVRQGGLTKVWEVIKQSNAPLEELKKEGDSAAKSFREKLDNVSPGLGNPVMRVEIDIENPIDTSSQMQDKEELMTLLSRIESTLEDLEAYFREDSAESSNIS